MDNFSAVSTIVHLNGGSLVGKTRLQKTFYFLEVANLGFGMHFEYYHYGPYSEDLSNAVELELILGPLSSEKKKTAQGFEYAEFSALDFEGEDIPSADQRIKVLDILKDYDSISVELAATADFLRRSNFSDFWAETAARKPSKASTNRLDKAKELLSELEPLISH